MVGGKLGLRGAGGRDRLKTMGIRFIVKSLGTH